MIHSTNTLTRVASQGPGQSIRISITTLVKPTRMDMHMGVLIIITMAIKLCRSGSCPDSTRSPSSDGAPGSDHAKVPQLQ